MEKIFILDKTTERHIQWNMLKNKLRQYDLNYNANLTTTELRILNCDILLLHINNDKEYDYIVNKNINDLKYTVVFFSGGIKKSVFIKGSLYLNSSDIEDFLTNRENYIK